MVEFFEILGGFEMMCFFMSFGLTKIDPQFKKLATLAGKLTPDGDFVKGSAAEAACWGREGIWGFEDCMYLPSVSARLTQRVGGSMGYRLFRLPPIVGLIFYGFDFGSTVLCLSFLLWVCGCVFCVFGSVGLSR